MAGCGTRDKVDTLGLATSPGRYAFTTQNYTTKNKSDTSKHKIMQVYAHL